MLCCTKTNKQHVDFWGVLRHFEFHLLSAGMRVKFSWLYNTVRKNFEENIIYNIMQNSNIFCNIGLFIFFNHWEDNHDNNSRLQFVCFALFVLFFGVFLRLKYGVQHGMQHAPFSIKILGRTFGITQI